MQNRKRTSTLYTTLHWVGEAEKDNIKIKPYVEREHTQEYTLPANAHSIIQGCPSTEPIH